MAGCGHNEPVAPVPGDGQQDGSENGDYLYVSIQFALDGETWHDAPMRAQAAYPHGGEDGDGREQGINRENAIYDATFFIYDGGVRLSPSDTHYGVNADSNTPIKWAQYIGQGMMSENTAAVKIPRMPITTNTQVVVVINQGDLTAASISTLGQLRDYVGFASMLNNPDPEQCDRFVMTSAAPSTMMNVSGGSSPEDPIIFNCDVQRMAARIDWCWYPTSQINADGHLVIPAIDRTSLQTVADVTMTNVRVFNRMLLIPNLLKRVTLPNSGIAEVTYLGREQVNSGTNLPSNYVVEPTFAVKDNLIISNLNHSKLVEWYGNTRYGQLNENVAAYPQQINLNERVVRQLRFDAASTNLPGIILGYTNENTMQVPQYHNAYCTGLLYEAVYTPRIVYKHTADGWEQDTDFAKGNTFWCLRAADAVNDKLVYLYFSRVEDALLYQEEHEQDLIGEIVKYEHGRCYYAYWLQHAGADENTALYPMKYGIVRNNIYRVAIRSIAGPGAVTPETTVTNENIEPIIYVKPWNVRVMDEVVM